MKKDRNTFFQESQFFNQNGFTPQVMNVPYQMGGASNSFYAGPDVPLNYNPQPIANGINNDYSDIEARLSKIERTLNRIDARISKLENNSLLNSYDSPESTNNVYMI